LNVLWTPEGWEDYLYWLEADPELVDKINTLIRDIRREPFRGIGKPEPLKGNFQGWWSRRITQEHRLIYRVVAQGHDKRVEIAQCRSHYQG